MRTLMRTIALSGGGVIGTIMGDETVQLMPLELIVLFSALFIVVGFIRGVRAEGWITAFIVFAFVILRIAGDTLTTWANRIYKLSRFGLAGGIIAENPVEIWEETVNMSPLIETDVEKVLFRMALFLALYLLGLVAGRIAVKRVLVPVGFGLIRELPDLGERLLGAVLGAVNGFLIAFFVLPRVLPARKETVIVVPETSVVTDFMNENVVNAAFAVVVIIILLGLMATGGIRQR
ncbi:MAG: hypothetical protein MAG451_01502 [Anaerolineales bacterium]|nr:hypothetical protein [Anaerolineales bacterium]